MTFPFRWTRARLGAAVLVGVLALGCLLHPGDLKSRVSFGTQVLDRHGQVLRITLAPDGQYRLWMPLADYPSVLVDALLFKEDKAFWFHPGVDLPALARAAWHSLVVGDYQAGGSTIPMQLARILFKLETNTVPGKIHQIFQALRLSLFFSKESLLELYLNLAPCGGNVEGFGTASRIYFSKRPSQLTPLEAATLVVLPQNPSDRRPLNPAAAGEILQARNLLARTWLQENPHLALQSDQLDSPLDLKPSLPFRAPHFVNWVLGAQPFRAEMVTTLDWGLQQSVERKVNLYLDRQRALGVRNAVVMVVNARTQEVLAQVGSGDFYSQEIHGQVDGTAARRSPGSTLKPFIYALALDQGLIHPATVLKDAKTRFGAYNPENYDNDFDGPVTAAEALRKSRNIPAVALAQKLKDPDLYDLLIRSGVALPYPRGHYGLSLVLGGGEVTMRELVTLYGALAGDGVARSLRLLLDAPEGPGLPVTTPESAFLIRRMLLGRSDPEGSREDRNLPEVAYKTGTSIGFRDSWSVGLFDGLIIGVWVGDFPGGSTTQFVGLRTAAPLMNDIVEGLRAGPEAQPYRDSRPDAPPESLVQVRLCAVSGQLATHLCSRTKMGWFIPGVSPIDVCSVHQSFYVDRITGLRRAKEIPGVTRTEVFEVWSSDILEIFARAGVMRRVPPGWDPRDGAPAEAPPGGGLGIELPVSGMTYLTDPASGEERLPLAAAADSAATTLYWFLGETFLGQSPRGQPFFWVPTPGNHQLKVVDDLGRTDTVKFFVRSRG